MLRRNPMNCNNNESLESNKDKILNAQELQTKFTEAQMQMEELQNKIELIENEKKTEKLELERNKKTFSLFEKINAIIIIPAVYSYFSGWLYLYYYYYYFGIDLDSLEISFYSFFVYSWAILKGIYMYKNNIIDSIAIIISIILLVISFIFLVILRKYSIYSKGISLIFVGFIAFVVCGILAENIAFIKAEDVRNGHADIAIFNLKKDILNPYPENFIKMNEKGYLILIAQTKNSYYVLWQVAGEEGAMPLMFVYEI